MCIKFHYLRPNTQFHPGDVRGVHSLNEKAKLKTVTFASLKHVNSCHQTINTHKISILSNYLLSFHNKISINMS